MLTDLALVANGIAPDGTPCLAVVANRAYRIVPGGRATPLADAEPVPEAAAQRPSSNPFAMSALISDDPAFEPHKPLTDVLLSGSAHSTRGSVRELETSLEVGAARKRALLMHFGTAKAVKGSALEDLEKAPGISKTMARGIYDHFHPGG